MGVLFSCLVEEEEDVPAGAALPAPGCGGGGNAGVEPTALKPSLAGSGKLRFERSLGSLIRREQQSPSARLQVDATKIPATSPRATVAPVPPVMPRELARTRFADAEAAAAPESPKHEAAAVTVQKVYKSFRTRRRLADCAVVVEQSWCVRRPSYFFFLSFQNPRPHCAAFVCLLGADLCVSIDAIPAGGSCWISRCSGGAPSPSLTSRGRSRRCPSGRGQEPELPRFGSHHLSPVKVCLLSAVPVLSM